MVKLQAAGNVITELSQKIPSSEFALKELIKNSYEAQATEVNIELNDTNSDCAELVISDNGCGMTEKNITSLLTISKSEKKFGKKINNRYVSGEKGIGFFSVFKFGNKVKVKTSVPKEHFVYDFSLDLTQIIKEDNISTIDIPLHKKSSSTFNGTKIIIKDLDSETIRIFRKTMNDHGTSSRLSNIINDSNFKINIVINGVKVVNDKNPTKDFESTKIAEFKYSSIQDYLHYRIIYDNEEYPYSILEGDSEYLKLIKREDFKINISVNVYSFKNTKINTKNAPRVYYYSDYNRIKPLVYINDSLFEDNNIYNTEINASRSSKYVFRQQTGIITIYLSNDRILQFNPDRTKINESLNYEYLKSFTNYLSRMFQEKLRLLISKGSDTVKHTPLSVSKNNKASSQMDLFSSDEDYTDTSAKALTNDGSVGDSTDTPAKALTNDSSVGDSTDSLTETPINVSTGLAYTYDELITLKDSEGGSRVKPLSLDISPENDASINKRNQTITFNSSELYTLTQTYKDKTTNETKIYEIQINATNKNRISKQTKFFIESLVDESDKLTWLLNFKNQINKVYCMKNMDIVFVSSIRTFVEVTVVEIVKALEITFSEDDPGLKKKLEKVLSKEYANDSFLDNIKDKRLKQSLESSYKLILEEENKISTIDVLNIYTHSGTRILSKNDVETRKTCIKFLFSYLNFVLNNRI